MADWGLLAGLGQGLTALGEGLNERELRKMAEEERRLQRQRQAEQDALQKAQAASGEFRQMDALNFRPASNTDALNNLALQRGQTEFKSDVSGQTFLRDPGMSPTDVAQAQKERDRVMKEQLAQIAAENRLEQQRMRDEGAMGRLTTQGANNVADNTTRMTLEALRQSGANFRDTNGVGGGSSRDMSLDKRQDRILAMTRDLMEPKFDRYGEVIREALPHEEAIRQAASIVDGITNPGQPQRAATTGGVGGQNEAFLALKAQQAIQAIQNDPARSPAEKAEDIQAVNQVLTQKIAALRGGR